MIIYNLHSLIALIFILPICYLLHFINVDFWSFTKPEFWLIALMVMGFGEAVGLKSRIYYLPFWLVAFGVFIWRSTLTTTSFSFLSSLFIGIVVMILSIFLLKSISKIRWEKSKEKLKLAREGNPVDIADLFYFPDYVYPKELFYAKTFESIYQEFQKRWFVRTDVRKHFLTIIKLLEKHENDEKTATSLKHLTMLLNKKNEFGIDQFHFINMKKLIQVKGLPLGKIE